MKKIILIIIAVLVVAALVVGGIMLFNKANEPAIETEDVSFSQGGVDVTAKVPVDGWFTEERMYIFRFYNPIVDEDGNGVIDLDDVRDKTPYIAIDIETSIDRFDIGIISNNNPEITDVDGREIGGIAMNGRTYTVDFAGTFIEYIGMIDDSHAVSVKALNLDMNNAAVKAILNSIEFSVK